MTKLTEWIRRLLLPVAVWTIKSKLEYLERLATASVITRADIGYMGKSADYWFGFAEGLDGSRKFITEQFGKCNSDPPHPL
jgi:hypothetical protein